MVVDATTKLSGSVSDGHTGTKHKTEQSVGNGIEKKERNAICAVSGGVEQKFLQPGTSFIVSCRAAVP